MFSLLEFTIGVFLAMLVGMIAGYLCGTVTIKHVQSKDPEDWWKDGSKPPEYGDYHE